jgi:hypothetical protein
LRRKVLGVLSPQNVRMFGSITYSRTGEAPCIGEQALAGAPRQLPLADGSRQIRKEADRVIEERSLKRLRTDRLNFIKRVTPADVMTGKERLAGIQSR